MAGLIVRETQEPHRLLVLGEREGKALFKVRLVRLVQRLIKDFQTTADVYLKVNKIHT